MRLLDYELHRVHSRSGRGHVCDLDDADELNVSQFYSDEGSPEGDALELWPAITS
jgi:hypothetical protein